MRVIALQICLAVLAPAAVVDRVAVVVGNDVITESEVNEELRLEEFMQSQPPDFSPLQRRAAADRLVDQQLIRQEMEVAHYQAPDPSKADAMLGNFRQQHFRSDADFRAALQRYGLTEDQLKRYLLWQLTVIQFTDERFHPNVQENRESSANRDAPPPPRPQPPANPPAPQAPSAPQSADHAAPPTPGAPQSADHASPQAAGTPQSTDRTAPQAPGVPQSAEHAALPTPGAPQSADHAVPPPAGAPGPAGRAAPEAPGAPQSADRLASQAADAQQYAGRLAPGAAAVDEQLDAWLKQARSSTRIAYKQEAFQ